MQHTTSTTAKEDQSSPSAAQPATARKRRWAPWLIVTAAGFLAWILAMVGVTLGGNYIVLLFPAAWCLYVAVRQARLNFGLET